MFQVSSDIRAYDSAAFVSSLPPLGGIVIGGVSLFVGSSGLLVGWFVRSNGTDIRGLQGAPQCDRCIVLEQNVKIVWSS